MHQHTTHKIVRNILRTIAKQEQQSFQKIKQDFIDGEPHATHRFWEILTEVKPNHHFTEVSHCPGCDKFSLE